MKVSKRKKANDGLSDAKKVYSIGQAIKIIKQSQPLKFDASVDMQMALTANPDSSDQVIRGTTVLPHGTGKKVRVVVLTKDEAGKAAKEAGADEVGGDELVNKIAGGWMDFDVVVASPSMMKDIAKLGRVLGPRGLMPSPKAGTVTNDLATAVKEVKRGRIEFKMDKQRNLHTSIGRVSFNEDQLTKNGTALIKALLAAKPKSLKGDLIKSASISSTMGPGVKLDLAGIAQSGDSDNE